MAGKRSKFKTIIFRVNFFKRLVIRVINYVPKVIWGGFAVFGIFLFGFLVGASIDKTTLQDGSDTPLQKSELRNVIDGYQDLSRLFYLQQQDMDIIVDTSAWQNNPEELSDALRSYQEKRDQIIFQYGRIYESRSRAGLPRDENLKTE